MGVQQIYFVSFLFRDGVLKKKIYHEPPTVIKMYKSMPLILNVTFFIKFLGLLQSIWFVRFMLLGPLYYVQALFFLMTCISLHLDYFAYWQTAEQCP